MKSLSDRMLLRRAREAGARAYAPYSKFKVGAALVTDRGDVFTGCNVENASYGLTVCAERAAVLAAVAGGRRSFRKLAVAAGREKPAYPCGACLQTLNEFCGPDFPILLAPLERRGKPVEVTLGSLIPKAFRLRR